jgi:hypothetical protein
MELLLGAVKAPFPRSLLRLPLLAAAAIACWLLVSGGPAHADDADSLALAATALTAPVQGADGPDSGTEQAAVPAAPVTPASGTIVATAGVLAGLLLLAPALLRRLGGDDDDRLPTGPAYPPGSLPD